VRNDVVENAGGGPQCRSLLVGAMGASDEPRLSHGRGGRHRRGPSSGAPGLHPDEAGSDASASSGSRQGSTGASPFHAAAALMSRGCSVNPGQVLGGPRWPGQVWPYRYDRGESLTSELLSTSASNRRPQFGVGVGGAPTTQGPRKWSVRSDLAVLTCPLSPRGMPTSTGRCKNL